MKKVSKLSLSALKENAEGVLSKNELKTLKGGYQYCTFYYTDPWGFPASGTGYTASCYDGNYSYLGDVCSGGCDGQQYNACASVYDSNYYSSCV